ncbi:hypothetical protein IMZ48_15520 [Candidatus Bathyarchaeota archaeon]|nr:hypothetical protein [Candidatus Bathyarchaeota archaeon]
MAEQPFNLDTYKCVNFTGKLWRVTHSSSQSHWDRSTFHMVAANDPGTFPNKASLKEAVEAHIDWKSRKTSPFLSVFSDEGHARQWALWRNPPVYIHEIDTTHLPTGPSILLDMEVLMAELKIKHEFPKHELLFLHRIPYGLIKTSETLLGKSDPDRPYAQSVPLQWESPGVGTRGAPA